MFVLNKLSVIIICQVVFLFNFQKTLAVFSSLKDIVKYKPIRVSADSKKLFIHQLLERIGICV